jgi:hypothetical protein
MVFVGYAANSSVTLLSPLTKWQDFHIKLQITLGLWSSDDAAVHQVLHVVSANCMKARGKGL